MTVHSGPVPTVANSPPKKPLPGGGYAFQQATDPSELAPGTLIDGRYRVIRVIGVGGTGIVYEVEHDRTGQRLALKTLLDPAQGPRLEQEARALARLRSPHVVKVVELGQCEAGPFMVMTLLVGRNLRDVLESKVRLPLSFVANLAVQVAEGLDEAHRVGLVHRDLKPDNMHLADPADADTETTGPLGGPPSGTRPPHDLTFVTVFDFGVVKMAEMNNPLTRTGSTVGTPYYMSLEQLRGAGTVDPQSDVYALCVVLYECLAGQRPFEAGTLGDLIFAICSINPTPLSQLRPDISPELAQTVMRGLSREKKERPATMRDLARVFAPHADPSFTVWLRLPEGQLPAGPPAMQPIIVGKDGSRDDVGQAEPPSAPQPSTRPTPPTPPVPPVPPPSARELAAPPESSARPTNVVPLPAQAPAPLVPSQTEPALDTTTGDALNKMDPMDPPTLLRPNAIGPAVALATAGRTNPSAAPTAAPRPALGKTPPPGQLSIAGAPRPLAPPRSAPRAIATTAPVTGRGENKLAALQPPSPHGPPPHSPAPPLPSLGNGGLGLPPASSKPGLLSRPPARTSVSAAPQPAAKTTIDDPESVLEDESSTSHDERETPTEMFVHRVHGELLPDGMMPDGFSADANDSGDSEQPTGQKSLSVAGGSPAHGMSLGQNAQNGAVPTMNLPADFSIQQMLAGNGPNAEDKTAILDLASVQKNPPNPSPNYQNNSKQLQDSGPHSSGPHSSGLHASGPHSAAAADSGSMRGVMLAGAAAQENGPRSSSSMVPTTALPAQASPPTIPLQSFHQMTTRIPMPPPSQSGVRSMSSPNITVPDADPTKATGSRPGEPSQNIWEKRLADFGDRANKIVFRLLAKFRGASQEQQIVVVMIATASFAVFLVLTVWAFLL